MCPEWKSKINKDALGDQSEIKIKGREILKRGMLFNISFFQKYERKWFKMIDFD